MSWVRFGIVADCQYADADRAGTERYYRQSLAKLEDAVRVFNGQRLSFVVSLGDLVDRHAQDVGPVQDVLAELTVPVLHVLGNHDLLATDGDLPAALTMLGMAEPYYGRTHPGLRMLFLNTNEDSALAERRGSPAWERQVAELAARAEAGEVNARRWNGAVGAAQMLWLRRELDRAADAGQRVLVFQHGPVAPLSEHATLNADAVLATLDGSATLWAVFAGHRHRGSFVVRRGIPHVTLQGMVQTPENAFAVVTVEEDHLVVEGYGREASRRLPYPSAARRARST